MILNYSRNAETKLADAVILQKDNFPKECCEIIYSMEKRGRLDFSDNRFFILETDTKTIIAAIMKENFPINDASEVKNYFGNFIRFCKKENLSRFNLFIDNLDEKMLFYAFEGMKLGEYNYKKGSESDFDLEVNMIGQSFSNDCIGLIKKGNAYGNIICDVRDMVNKPSDIMTPERFVKETKEMLGEDNVECEIFYKEQLEALDFKALLSVSQGSKNPPAVIIMRYKGDKDNPHRILSLLGKGITFDSGGLSLKSKKGMITMHHDMAGAAAVVGAMRIISMEKPKANVVGMAVLCENMLSENAYRPGDIIDTMSGKTVLINSTDAEGRLILADGITYLIEKEKTREIVDIATLTGGVVAALGDKITGFVSNSEELSQLVFKAGEESGDTVWKMPLAKCYSEKLKAAQADLANSSLGDGPAMIIGSLFLSEFIGNIPWVHIDCAGTAWCPKEYGRFSFGGTAVGCELLANIVNNYQMEGK